MSPTTLPTIIAAGRGWSFADLYAIGLVFCAIAIFAAIGALSHQRDRAFSASIIYLGLGALAALGIEVLGLSGSSRSRTPSCSSGSASWP